MSGDEGDGGLGTGGGRSRFSLLPPPAASFHGAEAGGWAPQPQPRQEAQAQAQPHHRKLPSYVSEPPSAMAAMRAYAQELLAAQGDPDGLLDGPTPGGSMQPAPAATPFDQPDLGGAQQPPLPLLQLPQQQGTGGDTPTVAMAGARSVSPRTAAGLEMAQLPLGVKVAAAAALASKQHFDLPSTLPSPNRQSAELEPTARMAAGGAGAVAGGAAATTPLRPHPHLRTSIGERREGAWCRAGVVGALHLLRCFLLRLQWCSLQCPRRWPAVPRALLQAGCAPTAPRLPRKPCWSTGWPETCTCLQPPPGSAAGWPQPAAAGRGLP